MLNRDNGFRTVEFVDIHDGDTFYANIITWDAPADRELSFRHIRVKDWNAKELREAEGPAMRDQFEALLRAAKNITVKPYARSFERIVCAVFLDDVLFAGLLHERLSTLRRQLGVHPESTSSLSGSIDQGRRISDAADTDTQSRDGDAGGNHEGDA